MERALRDRGSSGCFSLVWCHPGFCEGLHLPPHVGDPKRLPISPHSGPSSFSVSLTTQALMLTVGPPEAPYELRDKRDDRVPQGQLPGRCFKDRLPSPVSYDPNLWLCLMGFASLCIVLWLFIWVKNVLPFMSEQLPPSFVHCEVFCALACGEGRVVLLLRRRAQDGARPDRPSLGAASWGSSALWATSADPFGCSSLQISLDLG